MTNSGGGRFALASPALQILVGLVPRVPPVIYAHGRSQPLQSEAGELLQSPSQHHPTEYTCV